MTKLNRLQRLNRKAQSASRADLPVVITRQCYALSLLLDKVHRREMKSIERSDWFWKTVPKHVPRPAGRVRQVRSVPTKFALRRYGSGRAHARGYASKSHTRSADCESTALARALQAGGDLQREAVRAQPMYRDRSTLAPVVLQFVLKFAEGHHRIARRHASSRQRRRSNPTLAHGFRQHRVGDERAAARLRRTHFRDDSVAIGDEDGLAALRQTHIFAQFIL